MKSILLQALILVALSGCLANGNDRIVIGGLDGLNPDQTDYQNAVLLALSGGGARGLGAIGILKAFEEKGVKVAGVAGVSMGGIIGGLYAAGYSPDDLIELVGLFRFDSLFNNAPARQSMFLTQREERGRHLISVRFNGLKPVIPKALTKGQRLTALLASLTTKANYHSGSRFKSLSIPFSTIATDIVSGEAIVLDTGSLTDAMRATMAFPLAFTPLDRNGQLLMDGGMLIPIPVELARTLCDSIDFVVAVNTASTLLSKRELNTPIDIASQVTTIMTANKLASQLAAANYVVKPPLEQFESTAFKFKDSIINIGYRAGLAAADSILELLKSRHNDYSLTISVVNGSAPPEVLHEADRLLVGKPMLRSELIASMKTLLNRHHLFRLEILLEDIPDRDTVNRQFTMRLKAFRDLQLAVTSFRFEGNSIYGDSILHAEMRLTSEFITAVDLRLGLQRITDRYHADGYGLTEISNVVVDPSDRAVTVVVDEAIIYRIDVENNQRTRDWFVRSHFPLQPGEAYSTAAASQGIANIYGTDLFNRVTVDLVRHPRGAIVKITVNEKYFQQLRLGWHWDDEYRSEEFVEVLDDNVLGMGLQYLFHARYSIDRRFFLGSFRANRIWSTYLTARLRLSHSRLNRQLFNPDGSESIVRKELKTTLSLELGQQIARLGTLTGSITVEQVEYHHSDGMGNDRFGLRVLAMKSLVENLDRERFPTIGNRHLMEFQAAGTFMGGEHQYTRFLTSLERYFPLGKLFNYHPRLRLGLSAFDLPPSEKFYLGGLESFAGFRTNQLSGDKVFLFSNEIRLKLPGRFYFSARHYLGEVYGSTDEMKLRNLRNGVGLILSYDSPLGPFEFGYGVADSDTERYYVNIGLKF